MVVYQVRESNRIAAQQAASNAFTLWTQSAIADVESGVFRTVAKSLTNPEELTLTDKLELDAYYQSVIYRYMHDFITAEFGQTKISSELKASLKDELRREAPALFISDFSREWFQSNMAWIHPEIAEALEFGLKDAPIGSEYLPTDR